MCEGRLSRPACLPLSNLKPNLVAIATWSRNGPVRFGRIEERHTALECRADDRHTFLATSRRAIAEADPHAAEAERGHFEAARAQQAFLHAVLLLDVVAQQAERLPSTLPSN
jgi:hypothetical protein